MFYSQTSLTPSTKRTERPSVSLHVSDAWQPKGNQHSTVTFALKVNNNKYGNAMESEGIKTCLLLTPEKSLHHVMCVGAHARGY